MIVTLPWPPSATSPNASRQGNWRKKSEAAKKYKATCAGECKAQNVKAMSCEAVDVTVTFHPPSLRRYDLDNALAGCKQGLDAVSLAIGVDDAQWRSMTLVRGDKVKGGRVIVKIEVASSADTR